MKKRINAIKTIFSDSTQNPVQDTVDKKILKDKIVRFLIVVARTGLLLGLSFVLIYPLLYMLSVSFRTTEDILNPMSIWVPRSFTFENITEAVKGLDYGESIKNTLAINTVSCLLQVVSSCAVGYGFARFRMKGGNFLFALVVFTIIVPPQLVIVPSYLQFRYFDFFGIGRILSVFSERLLTLNLIDTAWTFYVPAFFGNGIRYGLFVFIFRQFFANMPGELQESAYIDGCGQFRTFLRIMLPNAIPAIITAILFSFVWYWNDFYYGAMYFNNIQTISLALANLRNAFAILYEYTGDVLDPYALVTRIQAGSLLTIGPVLILYLILQKYFVESIDKTGIVG